MQITGKQMEALGRDAERDLEARIADHLRERHPGAVAALTAQALQLRIRASLARGRSHGLTWQSALAGFTVLMFELGPEFDRQPAFARALAIRLPDENARIKAVYANTGDEDWAAARALADPRAWAQATQELQ